MVSNPRRGFDRATAAAEGEAGYKNRPLPCRVRQRRTIPPWEPENNKRASFLAGPFLFWCVAVGSNPRRGFDNFAGKQNWTCGASPKGRGQGWPRTIPPWEPAYNPLFFKASFILGWDAHKTAYLYRISSLSILWSHRPFNALYFFYKMV